MNQEQIMYATGLSITELGKILNQKRPEQALKKKGTKYWKRFLILKKYEELRKKGIQKNPIVIIVSGIPCSGKTTLAKELNARLSLGNVLGGDAFRSSLREFVAEKEYPAFFSSVYNAWKAFGAKTNENMQKGFESQAEIMNYAIERIIVDRCLRDGESMVFEYLHFLPKQYTLEVIQHPSVIPLIIQVSKKQFMDSVKTRETTTHLKGNAERLIEAYDVYAQAQDLQIQQGKELKLAIIQRGSEKQNLEKALDIVFKRIEKLNTLAEKRIELNEKVIFQKIEHERNKYNQ